MIDWPSRWARQYVTIRAEPASSRAMAQLHATSFRRPWTDGEFSELIQQDGVFAFLAREEGRSDRKPVGFVMARNTAGEAEILTLVVDGACRRRGIGRMLMDAVLRELYSARSEKLFLEVDETNMAAVSLYRRMGFRQVGERKAYYQSSSGKNSALVMRLDLK